MNQNLDPEIEAMTVIAQALTSLDDHARSRVIDWAVQRFNISKKYHHLKNSTKDNEVLEEKSSDHDETNKSLSDIIEFSEDCFIFHFRDPKAKNQSDAVNRLLHIALYAHEKITGTKETPRKILTEVLEEWRANDGNARAFINNHPGFKRRGTGAGATFFLDRPGKIEAERFIEEIRNDELIGVWSPSKKSQKRKENKKDLPDTGIDE